MRYYRFAERKGNKAVFAAFLLVLLFLARDTLMTSSLLGVHKSLYLLTGLMGVTGLVFLWAQRRNWKAVFTDRRIGMVLLITAVILGPMVLKRDWQMMYFSIVLCLYFAVLLTYFVTFQETAKYYVVILAVLGIYSVIANYILRLLPDNGLLAVPVFRNPIDFEFYNFGLSYVSISYVKTRNFGIFREPGVYQFFLILGLYLNHYWVRWQREKWRWIVSGALAVTMVSTFATGGIIELGLLAVIVFFDKKLYRSKWVCWGVAILAAAVVAVVAYCAAKQNALYWELYDMLIGKFQPGKDSSSERVEAVLTDIAIFLQHPLLGEKLSDVLHAVRNNTTSTLVMFAIFGITGGLLHVGSWVALVWKKEQHLLVNLALLLVLFMSFNTQNLTVDVFFWLFPVMALTERGLPLLGRKE